MSDYELRQKLKEVLSEEEGRERSKVEAVPIGDVIDGLMKELDRPTVPRIRTHLGRLNYYLSGGFGPGDLVYLAARAGVGKTALALQFAVAAARDGAPTLISSHEMMNEALGRRVVSQQVPISASSLKSKDLTSFEARRIVSMSDPLKKLPLWLCDSAQDVEDIYGLVAKLHEENGLKFLIVDYLQRVHAPTAVKDRRLQVENVSSALKSIAMHFSISILCMSAVSRTPKGQSSRLSMESLRESGNLEHDADVIILMDRDIGESAATIRIEKNRDGATGSIEVDFESEYVRFSEAGPEEE